MLPKPFLFLSFLTLITSQIFAQKIVVEAWKSEILKQEVNCSVYLPPSFENSTRNYPVLYLLHGMGNEYWHWANRGEVAQIAGKSFESGKSSEMVIVMPDGLKDAFYINNYDKSVLWEDFFYKELIPMIEKKYRIVPQKGYRAIAGFSMGGYGAMYHALKHREMFSTCYAMAGAYIEMTPLKAGEKSPEANEAVFTKIWGPRNTTTGLPENYYANSPHEIVKAMPEYVATAVKNDPKNLPKFYIDCGDDDILIKNNTSLFHLMREKKIPVEFRVRDGEHIWTYWRSCLALALEAVAKPFRD